MNAHAKKSNKKPILNEEEIIIWKTLMELALEKKRLDSIHKPPSLEDWHRPFSK